MTSRPSGGNGLTYKDAGVDIDAGDALVKRIAPFARATRRANRRPHDLITAVISNNPRTQ